RAMPALWPKRTSHLRALPRALHAYQPCAGIRSAPRIDFRKSPTKPAISTEPAGSCGSISNAGGEREPPSVEIIKLTELNDEERHQNCLRFRPGACGRRTNRFAGSVFRRPE